MGYALAEEAAARGARVILVSGPTGLKDPAGVEILRVRSAREMDDVCRGFFDETDIVIGAAAVADYRPLEISEQKIKKNDDELTIRLARNPDILAGMGQLKKHQFLVGFAAETNDVMINAQNKMMKKNLDLLVANDLTQEGAGFGVDTNIVSLLLRDGSVQHLPQMPKTEVAKTILDTIVGLLQGSTLLN